MRHLALVSVLAALVACAAEDPAKGYNVDPDSVTVGGLSAGAFMAVQMHVAYSSLIRGAAVFAGGPYYCAQGSVMTATSTCMNALPTPPSPSVLLQAVHSAAAAGNIDPVSNLVNASVYLYSGTQDSVVHPQVVQAAEQLYQQLVTRGNVSTEYAIPSQHTIPTADYGNPCSQLGSPYINKCDYDGAGAALAVLYRGALVARGAAVDGNLMTFDQTQFGASAAISLNSQGYIYVPTACQQGARCRLHVNMHGCEQTISDIQDTYARHAGFNAWAESNGIIVVYPQAVRSNLSPSNPNGCFDWWGYTGASYASKTAPQMKFVKAVIDRLMGN